MKIITKNNNNKKKTKHICAHALTRARVHTEKRNISLQHIKKMRLAVTDYRLLCIHKKGSNEHEIMKVSIIYFT